MPNLLKLKKMVELELQSLSEYEQINLKHIQALSALYQPIS